MAGSSGPEPLASCQLLTAKTAMEGVLRSSQYFGTDAGVERAGGTALGSEKGHQLPLVICCCGA